MNLILDIMAGESLEGRAAFERDVLSHCGVQIFGQSMCVAVMRPCTKFLWTLVSFMLQSRLSVNAVTAGDYSRPVRIARFIADLDAGFRLLNLKNDALRRRYDALKYDLKKAEEVVYDLTVRGLVNHPTCTDDDPGSVAASEQTDCKS